MKNSKGAHTTFHKFEDWLIKNFGENYNDRLFGYEAMCQIEEYIKENKEIKIVHCDDDAFAGSIIVLIPHPTMGISVKFIPQCTNVQNTFFLYDNHYDILMKVLTEMKYVYEENKNEENIR